MTTPSQGQAPDFLATVPRQAPSTDRLTQIQNKVAEARDLTRTIKDLEERLEADKATLNTLVTATLPDMLMEVGLDHVGVEASGNMPAYDAELDEVVRANIAAAWDQPKKDLAYQTLERHDAANLIKTTVVFEFEREDRVTAKEFLEKAEAMGYLGEEKLSVHTQTLGAWLRAEIKAGRILPSNTDLLNAIGGYVGKIVKIKQRRER